MPQVSVAQLNNKRTINGWAMFDWANSAYALVITTAVFPAYYNALSEAPVTVLGKSLGLESLLAFAISTAYVVLALLSPLLSGIADASGKKLTFLRAFTLVGSLACMGMWWFGGIEQLGIGTTLYIVGTIGYAGALVFYNAFLPEIATEDRYDSVSAKGFSFGYVGSVLLLLGSLGLILNPQWVGLDPEATGTATRITFVAVGAWWLLFAQFAFSRLPRDSKLPMAAGWLKRGYKEIASTWRDARTQPALIRFLTAFFFYSAGVQTVLFLASTFAGVALGFETTELIIVVLILQVVAIGGAHLFAKLSQRYGNINSLLMMLLIWTLVCLGAYFVTDKPLFYGLAALVGLVMGGIQSLSRSTYSKLIPEETSDNTSYFSFYDLLEKLAIVSGTLVFGLVGTTPGGMRLSMLALTGFFIIGAGLLWTVKKRSVQVGAFLD